MVSPPEPAAGTSTGGSWMTSSCAPESTRTVASGSVSGPGPRRAASSATRKRTARMPAAPGVEVRTTYRLACVLATAGRRLPECRGRGLRLAAGFGGVKRSGGFVWGEDRKSVVEGKRGDLGGRRIIKKKKKKKIEEIGGRKKKKMRMTV